MKPLSSLYLTSLRGYAIIAVLIIHVLWLFGWGVFYNPTTRLTAVILDQLVRFCVPLFITISGYTLMLGYGQGSFPLLKFFSRRILKILPLYVLWSAVYIIQGAIIHGQYQSVWQIFSEPINFLNLLIKGQSYYHLYFVPLIVQLYLLFPILRLLLDFRPHLTFIISIILQAGFYFFLLFGRINQSPDMIFRSDYSQYVIFLSFIGYFVLGMYLAKFKFKQHKHLLLALVFGLIASITESYLSISSGYSPLMSTAYTRLPMMLLLLPLFIILFTPSFLSKFTPPWLVWLGNQSYLIFLCHAAFLRVFIEYYKNPHFSTPLLLGLLFPILILVLPQISKRWRS